MKWISCQFGEKGKYYHGAYSRFFLNQTKLAILASKAYMGKAKKFIKKLLKWGLNPGPLNHLSPKVN